VFPAAKLAPGKNNVRPDKFAVGTSSCSNGNNYPPTPLYNAAVLRDMGHAAHLAHVYRHMKACPALCDAFILVKIWLGQRGLAHYSFLVKMLITHLLAGAVPNRKLAAGFSSYQLLRGILDFIADHDFATEPVFVGNSTHCLADFSPPAFSAQYDVVVLDQSGMLNIASWMSKWDMAELQHEAKLAMKFFDETEVDNFRALFLYRVDQPELKFDSILRFSIPNPEPPLYHPAVRLKQP